MVEEVTATHQAVVDNLGGRLPLVDASLFLFRYIFDSGTIHRSGTKASTDIDRSFCGYELHFHFGLAVS